MLNIGLLGCGRIGQVHSRSIGQIEGARVTAVADAFEAPAKALAEKTGAAVMNPQALITSPDVDAVVIGTPTDTHYDLIHAAAAAGKAILCEKPVDMSADRIRDCIAAVEAAAVPFMTAFNRRFDPNFASVQARIAAGEIGGVEIVTIQSRDPSPPPISYVRSSGGLFRDMMIHDLDMARFLLGEEPATVYAVGASLVDPEIGRAGDVHTAAVTLPTKSGRICQITNSRRASYGYDQRIEVHGEKGMLRAENILENTVEIATSTGFTKAPAQHFFLERYDAAYRAEMAHFVDSVVNQKHITPGIVDGLRAQALADAASTSSMCAPASTVSAKAATSPKTCAADPTMRPVSSAGKLVQSVLCPLHSVETNVMAKTAPALIFAPCSSTGRTRRATTGSSKSITDRGVGHCFDGWIPGQILQSEAADYQWTIGYRFRIAK